MPVLFVFYLLCAPLLCKLGLKLSYFNGKNNKVVRYEDKEWHNIVIPMFLHLLLALASVCIRGASSTESALVVFSFPVAWTLHSVQTAFLFLMICISNIFFERQKDINLNSMILLEKALCTCNVQILLTIRKIWKYIYWKFISF